MMIPQRRTGLFQGMMQPRPGEFNPAGPQPYMGQGMAGPQPMAQGMPQPMRDPAMGQGARRMPAQMPQEQVMDPRLKRRMPSQPLQQQGFNPFMGAGTIRRF